MSDRDFVHLKNLQRSYREGEQNHPVLQGLSLSIAAGETVALLGRSGCGKSTLLNVISGIDTVDGGAVNIGGIDLIGLSEHQRTLFRRRHIGFIYQFFNLIPTLTAAENIALVLELNGFSSTEVQHKTQAMLTAVGLDQQQRQFPDQLSGGQQQRVAIARALVHAPSLILADELTGNLDAQTGAQIMALLRELLDQTGATLLLVTHSLAVANTADRIVTLEDGLLQEREGHFAW
ncbi:MAG: putative ABC transport system ATP-binding protein [Paraglaciecola psychrophila]|jgi:putative ABC transport system ATP-binding protein